MVKDILVKSLACPDVDLTYEEKYGKEDPVDPEWQAQMDIGTAAHDMMDQAKDAAWHKYEEARDAAADYYEGAKDAGWHAYEDAKEAGWHAYEGARDAATDAAWNAYEGAKDAGWNAYESMKKKVLVNPLQGKLLKYKCWFYFFLVYYDTGIVVPSTICMI